VRAWLLAIARNVCADHVRRRVRHRRLVEKVSLHTVETHVAPPDLPEPVLAILDDDRREAFVLTQILGYSYEDAAAIVGCPVGTIRSRVFRARAELVEALRPALAAEG
jgi:RNA polymerase sigma-70 factor (ECF subfamily)